MRCLSACQAVPFSLPRCEHTIEIPMPAVIFNALVGSQVAVALKMRVSLSKRMGAISVAICFRAEQPAAQIIGLKTALALLSPLIARGEGPRIYVGAAIDNNKVCRICCGSRTASSPTRRNVARLSAYIMTAARVQRRLNRTFKSSRWTESTFACQKCSKETVRVRVRTRRIRRFDGISEPFHFVVEILRLLCKKLQVYPGATRGTLDAFGKSTPLSGACVWLIFAVGTFIIAVFMTS